MELVIFLVLCYFNDGVKVIICVLKEFGIVLGIYCRDVCVKFDYCRLSYLERKGSVEVKKRRK